MNLSGVCRVEEGMNLWRRPSTFLRVTRALSCSLALHAVAWTALREGPAIAPQTVTPSVALLVMFSDSDRPIEVEKASRAEVEWTPDLLPLLPPERVLKMDAPVIVQAFFEDPLAADEGPLDDSESPYWQNVRRELAKALRWPSGWQTRTNVEVRVLALADGILPLAPTPGSVDPIQSAVRKALERAMTRVEPPPDSVVGRDMRLRVRFEPEPPRSSR